MPKPSSVAWSIVGFIVHLHCAPAYAHHSTAAFDREVVRELQGVISEVSWRNPHVYLTLQLTDASGARVSRTIEAGPPSVLLPRGVTADTIRAGDRVTIRANPDRRGEDRTLLGVELRREDGAVVPLHASAMKPFAPSQLTAESIAGTWVPVQSGMITLSREAVQWPLTESAGRQVARGRDKAAFASASCVPFGPPALMTVPVASRIELSPDQAVFTVDWMGVRRVVPIAASKNDARHPPRPTPSVLGHSIGWWEGGTLVVDTIAFAAHVEGLGFERPSSTSKHTVERFTLAPDRRRLIYEATVEDPQVLARPITARTEWDYRPDQKMSGLPCERDVAARYLED